MPRVAAHELPHSLEAEEYLLSCCFIDGSDTINRCLRSGMDGREFFSPANSLIFERMVAIHRAHGSVDIAMVAEDLKDRGQIDGIGGFAYLAQVSGRMGTTAQAQYFIDRVVELYKQRRKVTLAEALKQATLANDPEAIKATEEEIHTLISSKQGMLPPILGYKEFIGEKARDLPPELVAGLLHRGAKAMIAGGSKSFKTWVLLDLGLSIATGTPWWGFKTVQGRVLYVNMEIMVEFCEQRVRAIATAKQIKMADGFDSWHLRGYARDFTELMPQMMRAMSGVQYSLIILDPVYKILGERDENANGEVAGLLNEFEALAVKTGAAIAYGHHHSKGNQSEKDARDRSSGAGAWTRDPDTLIDLVPHAEEEHFTATFTLRNHPPRNPMVVKWQYPCMSSAPGLNPADLRKPGRPTEHGVADIIVLLEGERAGLSYGEWLKRAAKAKISESTFKRLLKKAEETGLVDRSTGFYRRKGD